MSKQVSGDYLERIPDAYTSKSREEIASEIERLRAEIAKYKKREHRFSDLEHLLNKTLY